MRAARASAVASASGTRTAPPTASSSRAFPVWWSSEAPAKGTRMAALRAAMSSPRGGGGGRQGGGAALVEDARALAAAEDEDVERRRPLFRREGVELLADRIAEDDALALEGREGRGEGHDGPAHAPPEQAGGESRPGVLFEDDRRDQEPRGEEDEGSRAVAAGAEDQRRR